MEDLRTATSVLELHWRDKEAVNDNLKEILNDHTEVIQCELPVLLYFNVFYHLSCCAILYCIYIYIYTME